ncbi:MULTISPECIES: hypothetical protein [Acinetobacter]|jgi:hypothetical protein|uniref:hypothetical protein n=1 Tax=Acinetobacter TaxID=469 RepID=UPI0006625B60|nr:MULTISPECIES: hypothetical protein [Acinetobacter]KMU99885.1 hypothetical protein ACS72_08510 [Acinetobacter sp. VT 511]MBB4834136.1 hypothetical protein [Acinetobacter schindleri]PUR02385.1 hypothetical protein DCL20_00655 [Acinetobacter schindleri]WBX38496.1 SRPBCC family protein [Acinetobacter schindleri]
MKSLKSCLLLCLCTTYIPFSWAKIIPWTPALPSSIDVFSGSPQQLADLTGDRLFIYAHPRQSLQLPTFKQAAAQSVQFYSSAVVLPIPEAQVKKHLLNYQGYAGLFPALKSARILESRGHIQQVCYQVHIPTPIPVLNFKENVVMQHHVSENSIETLIVDAPIPYGAGRLEWFALGANKTLVTVTQWGDLNQPKGFLFSKILNALPEAKLGIPAGTNAFLLEALQQRFKSQSSIPLSASQIPQVHFNAGQIQKITQLSQQSAQPVSFILPARQLKYGQASENMRFSSSFHYYPQPVQKLQPWLAADASQQLFPRQIRKVELNPVNRQQMDANYKVSVGLGVIQIPFDFKLRYQQPSPLQSQFDAIGGDLKFVKAGMKLLPQAHGTLFQMTSSMKIHDQAPFLLRAMRSMPYHDILPAVGANTVYTLKVQQKLK